MTRFTYLLVLAALLLPFAIDVLVDSQSKAWKPPAGSKTPDADYTRHFYGDGQ
jgi:hypothetical protein